MGSNNVVIHFECKIITKIVTLKEFLKPSYEALKRERGEKTPKEVDALFKLLESDGADVAKSMIDFLSKAFIDISDGAHCMEWEKQTENLEIYVNIKRKGTE